MSNDSVIALQPFGTLFYLNFKSGAIQRWAARLVKNDHYYALTPVLWRRISGTKELPEGVAGKVSASSTLYFRDQQSADKARAAVIAKLVAEGVLK